MAGCGVTRNAQYQSGPDKPPIETGDTGTFSVPFPQLRTPAARCIGCVARPQAIAAGSRDRTNAVAFLMPISQYITAERALKNRDFTSLETDFFHNFGNFCTYYSDCLFFLHALTYFL